MNTTARWLVVVALGVIACKRPQPADKVVETSDASVAEPGDDEGQPHVDFVIDSVFASSKPTHAAPWHESGGDWTFFDAHTSDGSRFGFGYERSGAAASSFAFGHAMLYVPDATTGAKLVSTFARAFNGKNPPPAAPQPLRFEPFGLALLAANAARVAGGGFTGKGTWTATKLFLQRAGLEAEVFLNFDLAGRRGSFSQKDPDYADDLVAFLALELRDGPRPPRTPENDPRVSRVGPKLDPWRPLGPPHAAFYAFEPKDGRLLYEDKQAGGTRVVSAALDGSAPEVELLRIAHDLDGFQCAAASDRCVAMERIPKQAGVISFGTDPTNAFVVERSTKSSKKLESSWGDHGALPTVALSPDGSFLAIQEWRPARLRPGGSYEVLHFVPMNAGAAKTVDLGEDAADVVGWSGRGAELRALVRLGLPFDKTSTVRWFSVDPRTGQSSPADRSLANASDEAISPDHKRRVDCKAGEIMVTSLATHTERRFTIPQVDERGFRDDECATWANDRFLHYPSPADYAFLDADTMTISFPFAGTDTPKGLTFNADLTWAASTDDDGLRVARVSVR